MENFTTKKFNNLNYEQQLNLISASFNLIEENPKEKYCICRRGDDSLNFMIMCETCNEWFHGKCLKLSQSTAYKINNYTCIACQKRKETGNNINENSYTHAEFLNLKRLDYNKFIDFMNEYNYIYPYIPEYDLLLKIKNNCEKWRDDYNNLIKEIIFYCNKNLLVAFRHIFFYKNNEKLFENFTKKISEFELKEKNLIEINNLKYSKIEKENDIKIKNLETKENININRDIYLDFDMEINMNKSLNDNFSNKISQPNQNILLKKNLILDENIEKKIYSLFFQAEGFTIDNECSENLIYILRYSDWFKEAFKCIEYKKFSENNTKKLFSSFQFVFKFNKLNYLNENDKLFFEITEFISQNLIEKLLRKYSFLISNFNKIDKSLLEIFEDFSIKLNENKKYSNLNEDEKYFLFKIQTEKYINWKNGLREVFERELDIVKLNKYIEESYTFIIKYDLIDKFLKICKNFNKNSIEDYRQILFEDDDKNLTKKQKNLKNSSNSKKAINKNNENLMNNETCSNHYNDNITIQLN
jgi:hypothetical protein